MTEARLSLGRWGEEQAANYLRQHGFKILERNFCTPVGEIDIIVSDSSWLVFAEVKTRRGTAFGLPQEAVGPRKQRQIIRTAQWYIQNNKVGKLQPRFDVLAVYSAGVGLGRIEHYQHAFELD
jgi:putative endonuclease